MRLIIFGLILIINSCIFTMKSMDQNETIIEEYKNKSLNYKLQDFLYKALAQLWTQKIENTTWKTINRTVEFNKHPVLLYFIFRTYYDFAYAFTGKEITDLPENPNLSLDSKSRLKAFECLMLFRIKSRIDTDVCCEQGLKGASNWIHEEFGRKFKNRITALFYWNKKFQDAQTDMSVTFDFVAGSLIRSCKMEYLWTEHESPKWIYVCTKSQWGILGAWTDTFYFNDLTPDTLNQSYFGEVNRRRLSLWTATIARINAIAESRLSDAVKWNNFLDI